MSRVEGDELSCWMSGKGPDGADLRMNSVWDLAVSSASGSSSSSPAAAASSRALHVELTSQQVRSGGEPGTALSELFSFSSSSSFSFSTVTWQHEPGLQLLQRAVHSLKDGSSRVL